MKRIAAVLVILLAAVGVLGITTGAYTRDITGVLRKDAATMTEAVLKAIEYIIENGLSGTGATHDSAAATVGPQTIVAYDSTKPTAVADGDAVRALSDEYGRRLAGWEPEKWQGHVTSADASSTEAVIKAGTSAKKIAVLWIKVHCDVALDVTLEDESDNVLDVAYCAAKSGYVITFPPEAPLLITTADKNLQVQTSGAGKVSATAGGYLYP